MWRLVRWMLIVGVILAVPVGGAIAFGAWWQQHSLPQYTTLPVSRGRVETVVNSTGTVKPVRSVSVGAFISGPVSEVYVDFNSIVKKDDLLARIDPRLLEAAVDRDRAALATQKADRNRVEALLQQAINNEERAKKLAAVNKDYLSGTEMDQYYFTRLTLVAQKELAEAAIAQAKATLTNSEANLGYTEIRSPVDGIVIERKVDPGQTVAASFQTPELFIVAPDMEKHMHVYANVDEADIGMIRNAQERGRIVRFTVDAYPGDLFPGKVYQIRKNGTTNQNVVTYPVLIEASNPDLKLMPGMTANISFEIDAKDNVVRVPAAALRFIPLAAQVREEDKHFLDTPPADPQEQPAARSAGEKAEQARNRQKRVLWMQDGNKLRAVSVTLGLIDNQFAELIAGELTEGQLLVTGIETVIK